MGRTHVNTIKQPTDATCGPATIKHALAIFGKRRSVPYLAKLCKTSRNGTTTKNMIKALNSLGLSVLSVKHATLHHIMSSLKYSPNKQRAVIVDYLYDTEPDSPDEPVWDSGHWAAVSSFSARSSKIIMFDSLTGKKKSYNWCDFRDRWKGYDLVKKKKSAHSKKYRFVRRWEKQALLVVSPDMESLPKFQNANARVFPTSVN